jgi:hypothetical protein
MTFSSGIMRTIAGLGSRPRWRHILNGA